MITEQWLAGFFDGEGCVRLEPHMDGRYLYPVLVLAQKDRRVLREVQASFGGHLYRDQHCSRLRWNGKEALRIAKLLLPLSNCKRAQLQVVVDAAEVSPFCRDGARAELARLKKDIEA